MRLVALYDTALELTQERLAAIWFHEAPTGDVTADLVTAQAHLAYTVLSNGRAARLLYSGGDADQIGSHVRPMFEAVLKASYLHALHRDRAADLIDILPFEQMRDLEDYSDAQRFLPAIRTACLAVLRRRPSLLANVPNAQRILAGELDPPYPRIRKMMAFPDIRAMLIELNRSDPNWSLDLYPTIFRLTSGPIHGSYGFTRGRLGFTDGLGLVAFDLAPRCDAAPDYLMQATGYLLGTAGRIEMLLGTTEVPSQDLRCVMNQREAMTREMLSSGYLGRVIGGPPEKGAS
jgi:hypothetical protein